MVKKKKRTDIPEDVSAQAEFESDRTCCVCREPGKGIQIHHIDNDPSNHEPHNLAVLCFECHNETQLRGGFNRKLDADVIRLYRDNWQQIVRRRRDTAFAETFDVPDASDDLASITAETEILRENREYAPLAIIYDSIGNRDLRDKYIELALDGEPDDSDVIFLRSLQSRIDLIPPDVIQRQEELLSEREVWTERGRMYKHLNRYVEAAKDYLRGINESLERGNLFTAAYYAKEFDKSGLGENLFIAALADARRKEDLWWQIRALQELDWDDELDATLERHRQEIENSDDLFLQEVLAKQTGDHEKLIAIRRKLASATRWLPEGVLYVTDDEDETETDGTPKDRE